MNKVVLVYDNHITPNAFIRSIVGEKTFGEVVVRRRSVKDSFMGFVKELGFADSVFAFDYPSDLEKLIAFLQRLFSDCYVIHIYSHFITKDYEQLKILLTKGQYLKNNLVITQNGKPAVLMIRLSEYLGFIQNSFDSLSNLAFYQQLSMDILETGIFFDISVNTYFTQYVSGGLDARFFNTLKGDEFTITKSSKDKKKIEAEYRYYQLLPNEMKMWFAVPFSYVENSEDASYTIERYNIPDLALLWVHGAVDEHEFAKLMNVVFRFLNTRPSKPSDTKQYHDIQKSLYLDKVDSRLKMLKEHPLSKKLDTHIANGTKYPSVTAIADKYKSLYQQLTEKHQKQANGQLVMGHGDLCFSNMLYNKEICLLKLIDPKGARIEEELWTDPYYDLAKLSHSVCGRYDYINSGFHSISLDNNLLLSLEIDFDNLPYMRIFKEFCLNNGFDFTLVRLFEVSLFLSMLPFHMDNPQKVLSFILNAINIMEGLEKNAGSQTNN